MSTDHRPGPVVPVPQREGMPTQRAAFIFGLSTALVVAVVMLAVVLLALFEHPYQAALTMGIGISGLGLLRGAWPGQPWFASRNRWSDVIVFVFVGVMIILFAPLVFIQFT